ncbi:sodium/potassium/calcium exchanger 1-like isoform X2 [Tachysurus fulvidraco]|nr:sodium/potassium/calcium exchanger 1-like isoform X2 [Tachysurus fulvidraco]XP_047667775.1 sodium/potassium/calcium exchanger 1-like isoform X2 [Tachysurus fulvidraco]XP_047667776.1 sodium/potassium/calcium exchanger 1-like isoform X2 [Tachysurus fulvidraco]
MLLALHTVCGDLMTSLKKLWKVLLLKRWAVIRDSVTYMLSVVALIGITHDGKIVWWESLLLVVMYVGYILITIFNSHIQTFFGNEPSSGHERENDNDIQLRGWRKRATLGMRTCPRTIRVRGQARTSQRSPRTMESRPHRSLYQVMNTQGFVYSALLLLGSVALTFLGLIINKWKLDKKLDNDIQLRGVEEESNTGDADLSTDDPGEGTSKDDAKKSTDDGEPTSPFSIPTMAITRLCRTAPSMSETPGTSGTIRNWGEPMHFDFDMYIRNRVDTSPSPVDWSTMCKRFLGFFTFMMVMFGLGEVFPAYRPVAPKQYPYNNLYLEHGGDPEKQTEPAKHYEI